jgi:DNA polymerase-3 subunit alpha
MITSIRHHQTKKGEAMAFVEIEDLQASCELVIFPRTFTMHKDLLHEGSLIMVRGKIDAQNGRQIKIIAEAIFNEVVSYRAASESALPSVTDMPPKINGNGHGRPEIPYSASLIQDQSTTLLNILIPRTGNIVQDKHCMKMVFELLTRYPGNDHFRFYIPNGEKQIPVDFPNHTTKNTEHLRQQLSRILGEKAQVWVE